MPMLSWVGTSATAKVVSPITRSVAISVDLTADAVAVMPEMDRGLDRGRDDAKLNLMLG